MLPQGSFVCPNCGTAVSVTGGHAAGAGNGTGYVMPEEERPAADVLPAAAMNMPCKTEPQETAVMQPAAAPVTVTDVRETDSGFGLCTAGFVLSLLGFFTSVIFLMLIAGLVISGVGVFIAGRDTSHDRAGRGLGIAGIVIAAAGILLRIFFFSAFMAILLD